MGVDGPGDLNEIILIQNHAQGGIVNKLKEVVHLGIGQKIKKPIAVLDLVFNERNGQGIFRPKKSNSYLNAAEQHLGLAKMIKLHLAVAEGSERIEHPGGQVDDALVFGQGHRVDNTVNVTQRYFDCPDKQVARFEHHLIEHQGGPGANFPQAETSLVDDVVDT